MYKSMTEKQLRDFAKTKHKGLPQKVDESNCDSSEPQRDKRGDYAKVNLLKNKLRAALGVKNPIVMVSNEECEMVDEARAEEKRGLGSTGTQRQRQKAGVVTSSGQVVHPATSY